MSMVPSNFYLGTQMCFLSLVHFFSKLSMPKLDRVWPKYGQKVCKNIWRKGSKQLFESEQKINKLWSGSLKWVKLTYGMLKVVFYVHFCLFRTTFERRNLETDAFNTFCLTIAFKSSIKGSFLMA